MKVTPLLICLVPCCAVYAQDDDSIKSRIDSTKSYTTALLKGEPPKIDGFEGDWVEINIDSYADKRSAFSFTSSVSGVKGDEYVSNNGENWDASWDPIWYLKTSINSEGWIAEVRIPLSQLRFTDKPEH